MLGRQLSCSTRRLLMAHAKNFTFIHSASKEWLGHTPPEARLPWSGPARSPYSDVLLLDFTQDNEWEERFLRADGVSTSQASVVDVDFVLLLFSSANRSSVGGSGLLSIVRPSVSLHTLRSGAASAQDALPMSRYLLPDSCLTCSALFPQCGFFSAPPCLLFKHFLHL